MEVVVDWFLIVSIDENNRTRALECIINVAVARILFCNRAGARGFVW